MSQSRQHKKLVNIDQHDEKNCLSEMVRRAIDGYFTDLDGHDAHDMYELVISQVEKPLFESVMQHTRGNTTKAAEVLGMNRGTLRSRLRKYGLD